MKAAAPSPEQQLSDAAAARLADLAAKVKDFPELSGLAEAVQTALKANEAHAVVAARQTAEAAVAPLHTLRAEHAQRHLEETAAAYDAALQTFRSTYPNAVEVIRTPEFSAWIRSQPRQTQQAFQKGQTPDEAMVVMGAYDAYLRRMGKPSIAVYPSQPHQAPPKLG